MTPAMRNEMRFYVPSGEEGFLCHCISTPPHFYDFAPAAMSHSDSTYYTSCVSYQQNYLRLSQFSLVFLHLLSYACLVLADCAFFFAVIDYGPLFFDAHSLILCYQRINFFHILRLCFCSSYCLNFCLTM